jgi:hypothetical protein
MSGLHKLFLRRLPNRHFGRPVRSENSSLYATIAQFIQRTAAAYHGAWRAPQEALAQEVRQLLAQHGVGRRRAEALPQGLEARGRRLRQQ